MSDIFTPLVATIETFIANYPWIALGIAIVTVVLLIMLVIALVKKPAKKVIWLIIILAVGVPTSPLILARTFM